MGRIYVIGGANIDILGKSTGSLRMFDSNPGEISFSFGGVGRNIARGCAALGADVSFVTCFSKDHYGRLMKEDCIREGIGCSDSIDIEDLPSSIYLAILDRDRDMTLAMSDMRILDRLDENTLSHVLEKAAPDDMIIVDCNLKEQILEYIFRNAPCPVAADPVSTVKAGRLKGFLDRISVLKPNQYEAEEMSGIQITDPAHASAALDHFLAAGVREVIISMADKGILFGSGKERFRMTHRIVLADNVTGGGDTLLSAYCIRRMNGYTPHEALRFAAAAAVMKIEGHRDLCTSKIEANMDQMMITEENI